MNTVQLVHFSLSLAFEYLEQAVSDVTQEQANWLPPGKANSIGALYWHTIAYVDQLVHDWCMLPFRDVSVEEVFEAKRAKRDLGMGQVALRHRDGWQEKVVRAFPPENPEDPYWDVRLVREGIQVDLPALHDYAHATAQTLLDWAASLTPEDLERVIPTPWGDYNQGQWLEFFIIWHINVHCGEIASVKGYQGLKGYPW
jgi:hypothetical protein